MFQSMKRWWKYLVAKLNGSFNEAADPKVQLEQAIAEAQDQHRRLTEQAANVIANQKQTEMRLNQRLGELEKLNTNARQAVLMADEATRKGDAAKAAEYTQAAEAFANKLIATETEVEDLKKLQLQSVEAANQAKAAVAQNSAALQKKLSDKQKLLSQLDQAKMQERMNSAMAQITATVGDDVPTLNEVREKIEARHAKAMGAAELQGQTVESKMLEVEQASMNMEAQARLSQIRTQLGLGESTESTAPVAAPAESTAGEPAPAPAPEAEPTAKPATETPGA